LFSGQEKSEGQKIEKWDGSGSVDSFFGKNARRRRRLDTISDK
jgi:hypothetical protein